MMFTCSYISKLHSILAIANLLAHNNITISYYGQVVKIECSIRNGQVNIFGGTIYFAVDDTYIIITSSIECYLQTIC